MRVLGITQYVELDRVRKERSDRINQSWYVLAKHLGFAPMLLPNLDWEGEELFDFFESIILDAVILSGGNSLGYLDSNDSVNAPERDAFELALIEHCINAGIPMIGICRGMQILNYALGGSLTFVDGHVGTRHVVRYLPEFEGMIVKTVNSFHNWAIALEGLSPQFLPIAFDEAGHVEAFYHPTHRIAGIMWHPEREGDILDEDIRFMKKFLQ